MSWMRPVLAIGALIAASLLVLMLFGSTEPGITGMAGKSVTVKELTDWYYADYNYDKFEVKDNKLTISGDPYTVEGMRPEHLKYLTDINYQVKPENNGYSIHNWRTKQLYVLVDNDAKTISSGSVKGLDGTEHYAKEIRFDGTLIAERSATETMYKEVKHVGNKMTTTVIVKQGEKYVETVTTETCSGAGACTRAMHTYTYQDASNKGQPVPGNIQQPDSTELGNLKSKLEAQYGATVQSIDYDGTVKYVSDGRGTFTVLPAEKGESKVVFEKRGTIFEVVPGQGLLASDRYKVGNDYYSLSTKCAQVGDYCLKRGDSEIMLTQHEYELLGKPDTLRKASTDLFRAQRGRLPPQAQYYANQYYSELEAKTRGRLTQILNAYLDELLGPFSRGVPAMVCGDRMYKKETHYDNKISGIPVPTSAWESELQHKILEEVRTVVAFGDVAELSPELYRYEVTIKLIGDRTSGSWKVYLRNSCDSSDSVEFWHDYGSLGHQQVRQRHYAGMNGDDMVFEKGTRPYYKFDEVCVKLEDEGTARCFKLAGTITELCH